jgi:AcrR family transcriptional regulator
VIVSSASSKAPPEPWRDVKSGRAKEIVTAAMEVFAERGFHASTTRDIASRVGMSPAGLYVHFESKEEVLAAICVAAHRSADHEFASALEGPMSVDVLAKAVGDLAAWHAENPRMARVAQYELEALEPESRKAVDRIRRQTQDRARKYVSALVKGGLVDTNDVRSLTRGLMSICVDVCRWYDPAGPVKPAAIQVTYTDLARRMLSPNVGAKSK